MEEFKFSTREGKREHDYQKIKFLNENRVENKRMFSFPHTEWILEQKLHNLGLFTEFVGIERHPNIAKIMLENFYNLEFWDVSECHNCTALKYFQLSNVKFGFIELDWMGGWCQPYIDSLKTLANSQCIDPAGTILSLTVLRGREARLNHLQERIIPAMFLTNSMEIEGNNILQVPDVINVNENLNTDTEYNDFLRIFGISAFVKEIFNEVKMICATAYKSSRKSKLTFLQLMYKIR